MSVEQIGVIGAGTMGGGIAQTFAMAGYPVILQDISDQSLEHGLGTIKGSLDRLVKRERMTAEAAAAAIALISTTTTMSDLGDRDLVVEAIVENIEIKSKVLAQLDEICRDDAIFASNTSSISLTKLAAASSKPERVIGMHFFNPVPMMQLVEIIRALQTNEEVCDAITDVTKAIGKTPRVSKDSYGFVVNRVLVPMINEAINCLYEGLASPEDVDSMLKLGANHPMGPLALGDLIGLDIVLDIMETLYGGFDDPKYRPSPLLKQMVDAGYLGRKTGRGFFTYG
ncbi:MAG: 3-hydroxybutyryl-CoA dehydrogenase [Kiloniellales bacterium]|nr:3-hydroxybutyryl-CoA dehydrogenase [Kiloniellales bacterium]